MIKQKINVSVIIPALNEEQYIAACIQSIQDQDYDNYEIIVVDNGSKDHTAIIAKKMGVRVINEPHRGLPQAREAGRLAALGEILVYLDADMLVPKKYLSTIVKTFEKRPKVVAISNPFTFHDSDWYLRFLIKFFFKVALPFFRIFFRLLKMPRLIFGGNFAVRRQALEKINGFDTTIKFYGEDANLSKRISKVGGIIFLKRLYTATSARRYIKEGLLQTNLNYVLNYFSVLWCDHPIRSKGFAVAVRWSLIILGFGLIGLVITSLYNPTSELTGHVVYQLPTQEKFVALTFDDGPNGQYTQQILDILAKEKVPATFFMVGKNVEKYPELAREIARRGYKIGNHSYSHPWRLPFENKKSIWYEIIKTDDAIYQATGLRPKIFRPPHGLRTPWMIKELHEAGYTVYTWDDMTDDYVFKTKPQTIVKNILSHVQPGSIIVLHDGLNLDHHTSRENTVEALPIIIKSLKQLGYTFVIL